MGHRALSIGLEQHRSLEEAKGPLRGGPDCVSLGSSDRHGKVKVDGGE